MFRNGLQGWHIIVLLVVILLLFGANKLPGLARSVGQSLKIFKSEVKDLKDTPAEPAATPRGEASAPGSTASGAAVPPSESGTSPAA